MWNYLLLLMGVCYFLNLDVSLADNLPIVKTKLGQIQGTILRTALGKPIYAFRGIRYAKAPINDLRFQPPVPVEPWTHIYNASRHGAACPQPNYPGSSEDCLFINIFTTKLPSQHNHHKLPVLVYFHAGGYYGGSTEYGGPEYILDQDIVLVALNYRLATLGFLSTGDHLAPGNNGLKDQVLALKFVKDHITNFGGDPNQVTISGYSCGGSSTSLHMVSPMSKGLFQKAIMMSGSSFGNWPVPEEQFALAQKQARFLGCPDDTSANIVNCLKTKSAQEIGDTRYKFDEWGYEPIIMWYPVVERDFGQERFITEDPAKSVQCGRFEEVPSMVTVTTDEFAYQSIYVLENSTLVQDLNENWENVAPIPFIYERNTDNSRHISKALRKFYFGDAPVNNETRSRLEKIYADGVIGFTAHRAADLLASKSKKDVFFYRFDYHGKYSHYYIDDKNEVPFGVVHHDDLIYLYYLAHTFPLFNISSPDYKMSTKLTTLIANFVKTGKPTSTPTPLLDNVDWKPYTLKNKEYLDISDRLVMKKNLFKARYEAWDKVFPMPTCDKH